MKLLDLEIITPAVKVYEGKVHSITIPGTAGSFQVLYNHAPILSTFEIGKVTIEDEKKAKHVYATSGGTVEVLNNKILLLAEAIEAKEEIDTDRALESMKRAKERIAADKEENIDLTRAEVSLHRAINRLKISEHSY
ncbi:MAG: ATP synthase F1 subunit epsilon [Melioribacteraceae bacterium]